ncbi:class I SAM-dependent methyltransferase [Bacillus infantis]|uniref:class I SAM-dependent methyltransferase n=1 Tax=Bacillus infantis TaxID=324767 RepID=UPI003CEE99A2
MKAKVKQTFDSLAEIYEHQVDDGSLFNSEFERPAMLEQLPDSLEGKDILDAGCAAGWYTAELARRGANVTGADLSPEMISSAKRRIGQKARLVCCDLEGELPFDTDSFDWIFSSLTLHYLKDWNQTFAEFHRILRPGGTILFSVHHPLMDMKLLEEPDYLAAELIVDRWAKAGKTFDVPFYRRPLQNIINMTVARFSLQKVIEPRPTHTFREQKPEQYQRLMKEPHFLIIRAGKAW